MPLLLTSSIDPNNCSFTERKSIDDRKNDYMNSLFKWLTNTDFDIVYIDNSNYDLTFLKKTFAARRFLASPCYIQRRNGS
jgi:hypothetical protein